MHFTAKLAAQMVASLHYSCGIWYTTKVTWTAAHNDIQILCLFGLYKSFFGKTLFSMSLDSMTFMQSMMLGLSYYGLLESSRI